MLYSIDNPEYSLYSYPLHPTSPPPHGTPAFFGSPVITFLFSGMLMIKYILHVKDSIVEMLQLSSTARCTVRSTMVISWVLFIMLFLQYTITITCLDHLMKHHSVFHDFRKVFHGNLMYIEAQFALYVGIGLIELPILIKIFKRIFAQVSQGSKIQYIPMRTKISKILIKFSSIFGFIGIVFYVQIQTFVPCNYTIFNYSSNHCCKVCHSINFTINVYFYVNTFTISIHQQSKGILN